MADEADERSGDGAGDAAAQAAQAALAAVRESEARYRSLARAVGEIVWTTGPDGAVADLEEWRAYTGQSAAEVRGQGWLDALHPGDRGSIAESWTAAVAARGEYLTEYRIRRADGTYHWFRVRAVPVRAPDGEVREWVGVCTDIDREVRDAQARWLLARASEALAGALDERAALDAMARLAIDDSGGRGWAFADACAIDFPRDAGEGPPWFERVALAGRDEARPRLALEILREYPMPPDASVGYAHVIRTGEPQLFRVLDDTVLRALARDERHLERMRALDLHSALIVPVAARGRIFGAMSLALHGAERRRAFDEPDLAVAMELGRRLGVAIETARLYQAELRARAAAERAADRARRLQRLTAALSEAVTPEQVADVILQGAIAAIGADAGTLALVREGVAQAPEFEVVRTTGFSEEVLERFRRFPIERGRPLSDAVLDAGPVLLATPDEWRARYPELAGEMHAFGWRAFAAVPVVAHGRVRAGLSFGFRIPQAFEEGTRTFLDTLGEQCAQALERAWAFDAAERARADAERQADRIGRLQALTAALSVALTPAQVARAAVEHGAAAFDADAAVVVLASEDAQWLEIGDTRGIPEEMAGAWRRFPADTPVPIAEAFRSRVPVLVRSPRERETRWPAMGPALAHEATASVPLLVEDDALGALGLVFRRPVELTDADRDFLLSLGRLCAQAIRRASLYAAADAGNRAKSEFLATMSHELRTPLTAIIGYEELLADAITGPVNDEQRAQLARIKASAMHLLALIDEVLTFARMEAGKETVRREPVPVASVMESAAAIALPLTTDRRLAFHVRLPEPDVVIATDRGKLQQILVNLLGNAVKFTERGAITLSAATGEEWVALSVHDTGIGIPAEQLERIFEPFTQVESRSTRKYGGTGLGLSVTRQLARLLGGEVTVTSVVGEGSTFTVRLPRG